MKNREGKGREEKGREGKGREGKGSLVKSSKKMVIFLYLSIDFNLRKKFLHNLFASLSCKWSFQFIV